MQQQVCTDFVKLSFRCAMDLRDFYGGKHVLLTGATGFVHWLQDRRKPNSAEERNHEESSKICDDVLIPK